MAAARLTAFRRLALASTLGLAGSIGAAAQEVPAAPPASDTPAQIAHAVIADLVAGNFARVTERFTAQMIAALPEDRLRATWTSLVLQAGPLKQPGAERLTAKGAFQIVTVPCEFEKIWLDLQVVVDGDRKIAGLRFTPGTPPVAYVPPAYAKPDAYTEQETAVGTAPWVLPATLTIPTGAGPFPAVVLVHGSGPHDRDESIGALKPFRDLALGLASRGIAVLRYEKRSREHRTLMTTLNQLTVKQETIDDAALAVERLQSTARIDPRRVVVLGHSLGAMLIPRIATATPRAAGFIVMAGPARSLDQALVEQTKYLAELDGIVSADEKQSIAQMEQLQATVKGLTPGSPPVGNVPASYWLDLRGYDPPTAAKAIGRPLLVLQGERDYQVTPAEYARWQSALAGSPTATFHLYPGLNHAFVHGTGPGNPTEYYTPGHVAEEVIRDIANWVSGRVPQ